MVGLGLGLVLTVQGMDLRDVEVFISKTRRVERLVILFIVVHVAVCVVMVVVKSMCHGKGQVQIFTPLVQILVEHSANINVVPNAVSCFHVSVSGTGGLYQISNNPFVFHGAIRANTVFFNRCLSD